MARARAIETRLEKLVPALDEYYTSGFLTREETVEVSRQRQHWEFRLVAKPLLLLDVREAITYELGLEKRLREYCIYTKLNLQHRWDIVDRIEGIYKIGLKHLRNKAEHEALRQECVQFMKQFQRNGSLSNLYGELMVMHPRRSDIWVEAAEWQGFSQRNTDNARAIIQQALLTMASEPVVWACALHVELQFVQRLLEGLLAEHREEARKACRRVSKEAENGDEENRVGDAKAPAEVEPTSTIAPKLRAENEAMAHVLLDLALAKTVVEEAFDSPASGAVLLERLLAVAGTYAFSREVVELAVTTAAHKMAEACSGSADVTVEAARVCGARGASASSSLTIASDQQRLRVRTQWRHRHSVDTVFAHYLALEDLVMNQYPQTIVDTATYLAEGGSGVGATAKRRGQQRPRQPSATSASLLTPSQKDRRHAAVKAVVSLLTFSSSPTSVLADMPGVVEADTDSTKRFPAVRQAFVGALRHLATVSTEGVSRVCARLLRTPTVTAASTAAAATASHRNKKEEVPQPRAALDLAEVAQWLLGELQLDKATLQACVTEPRKRTERLLRKVALAADMHPPAKSRARHEAPAGSAAAAALMTWSVVQLERFLQADDRDVLVQSAGGGAGDSTKIPPCSPLNTAAAMTAEDVERFIVWWKEEEKLLRGRQETGDSGDALAASRARRRMAVMKLLHQHDLLPSVDLPTAAVETKKRRNNRKKTPNRGSSDATSEGAWAKTQGVLLNRSSALQFVPAVGTASPARLPLSLWRVFSALETLEGPMQISEKASWTQAAVSHSGSNSSDDDRDSGTGGSGVAARGRHAEISSSSTWLTSFAAAGLFFLGGVPYSTLSHEEEWVRLEGVTSLLQCRLFSWLGCRVCTRDTVAKALRLAESGLAEAWITDLHGLLKLAQRCQPLPRFAQTRCVLPFLEGVALFRSASASAAALSGQAGNLPLPAKAASDAVRAVREAYEVLLKLYGVSKHPESFLPLLYDGTSANKLAQQASTTSSVSGKASTAEVQQANAEDWVAYVWFERTISKDLLRAKTVVEQARREALAPQIFMVRLNAL